MNTDKNKRKVKDFLYEDLTYRIRGALYKVHKILGSGHKESVYHKALSQEFKLQGISFTTEKTLSVIYEGIKVGNYKPDFIVEDKVLIELKAVSILPIQAEKQLAYYLRGTPYQLGLLVNFGAESLEIRRRIWSNQSNQQKSA